MFSHYATCKISPTCKISSFFEDLSFLNPRSHLKERYVKCVLKIYYWEKWCTQNFDFLDQILELQLTQISLNFQTSCYNLKIRGWEQKCVWLFYYFHFERNYDVLKSKNICFLLNKNINFNENETKSKMENPTHTFRKMNLV